MENAKLALLQEVQTSENGQTAATTEAQDEPTQATKQPPSNRSTHLIRLDALVPTTGSSYPFRRCIVAVVGYDLIVQAFRGWSVRAFALLSVAPCLVQC